MVNEAEKNLGDAVVDLETEQRQLLTLDGCPITPGPWTVRAAMFCDDGIPSFEVVMPGEPHMSAVDARVIGAAPMLFEELKHSALAVHTIGAYHHPSWITFEECTKEICVRARSVLMLANKPADESAKRPISDETSQCQASETNQV